MFTDSLFSDYLIESKVSEEALFPSTVRTAASVCLHKTSNACESFHSHLNASITLWLAPVDISFVNILSKVESDT